MKTYSERVQQALFTAAAETFDAASAVLNDCENEWEFTGNTYEWARHLAAKYASRAQELKDEAVDLTAVVRSPVKYNRAQARYSEAVTRHLRLRQEFAA